VAGSALKLGEEQTLSQNRSVYGTDE